MPKASGKASTAPASAAKLPPELLALPPKQQSFVLAYVREKHNYKAAVAAGYKGTRASINVLASRLLKKANVQQAIAAVLQPALEQTQITAERILQEYAAIGFSDLGQILDFNKATPEFRNPHTIPEAARRAISSVKVKRYVEGDKDDGQEVEVLEFRLWDKAAALKAMGEHVGLFKPDPGSNGPSLHVHVGMSADEARQLLLATLQRR